MTSLLRKRILIPTFLLAIQAYRIAHPLNILFREPPLPISYFATADGKEGTCAAVHDPSGHLNSCEDIRFWDVVDANASPGEPKLLERRVVASCDPGRKSWNTVMGPLRDPRPRGALWVVDVDKNGEISAPTRMTLKGFPNYADFHPMGFDIFPSQSLTGLSNMFVVNQARDAPNIVQFTVSPSTPTVAQYVRTIRSRSLRSPNSIALSKNSSFYVTNDHFLTRRLPSILGKTLPTIESVLAFPGGYLTYVEIFGEADPNDPESVALRHTLPKLIMPFPNGVALSPDGKELAVASSSLAEVQFYKRVPPRPDAQVKGETLELTERIPMPFAADNLDYTESGDLIVAGHPHFPSLIKLAANETDAYSPSWVVSVSRRSESGNVKVSEALINDAQAPYPVPQRVAPKSHPNHIVQTIYQSNGHTTNGGFGGSTTALRDERSGVTFVSGLYEEGLLVCRP